MLFGVNVDNNKHFIIERAFTANVLSNFYCGIGSLDSFIHKELQDYLDMGSCRLFVVKEDAEIVGMFCLDNSNLTLSESAKKNMREGRKPLPDNAPKDSDDFYWLKTMYDATEITYLAVQKEKQHNYLGSSIIEAIMDRVSKNIDFKGDYVIVRALNEADYSAIPFYKKCGFTPAANEIKGKNLFMYRVVKK